MPEVLGYCGEVELARFDPVSRADAFAARPLDHDERALPDFGVAGWFYAKLSGIGQFLVIMNSASPADARARAKIQLFTGKPCVSRYGLFPERPGTDEETSVNQAGQARRRRQPGGLEINRGRREERRAGHRTPFNPRRRIGGFAHPPPRQPRAL